MWFVTNATRPKAPRGLIELDGNSIRALTSDDLPALLSLRRTTPRDVFHIPTNQEGLDGFLDFMANKPWSLPMMCMRNGSPSGLCLMNVGQLKHLNAYLVALFEEPSSADRLLALYIRQAFWLFPLHRLNAQLPSRPEVQPHIDLLLRAGFQNEGVLKGHIEVDGQLSNVVVLGMLRDDFDAWCAINDPRLSLA
jgi:hypothetical protein